MIIVKQQQENSMKQELLAFSSSLGISQIGIAPPGPYPELAAILRQRAERGHLTEFDPGGTDVRTDARLTMADARSIIVALFPYYTGERSGSNLAKYTWGRDYHLVSKDYLNQIGSYLQTTLPGFRYQAYTDTGPLVDRYLAWLAGLGFYGTNSCLINDLYGSWFFIGYLIVNHPFPCDRPLQRTCQHCGRCQAECPGQIILGDGTIDPRLCKSYLTQKKGALSHRELAVIRATDTLFGCDVCQDVCPHNSGVPQTPLSGFRDAAKSHLSCPELSSLSNRQFRETFGERAFSWRGKSILERNCRILEKIPTVADGPQ